MYNRLWNRWSNTQHYSRLKQNIDDLDTLLYDLNHAQHEPGPQEYAGPGTVDSDDYDETVGHEVQWRTWLTTKL